MSAWMMLGIGSYLLGSVLAYGITLAHFQREYPTLRGLDDMLFAACIGLLGPIGAVVAIVNFGRAKHGLQFIPKAPEPIQMPHDLVSQEHEICPLCDKPSRATPGEIRNDSVSCVSCLRYYRPSTGKEIQADLGDDEPDWTPADPSEIEWARSTMPGKADGHTIAWRTWGLKNNTPRTLVDGTNTAELLELDDTQLCDRMAQMHNEVIQARTTTPYLLLSGNNHEWKPSEPMVGYKVEDMPRAHGAGIYAMKEPSQIAPHEVVGQIAMWGSVVEHESGYRARYAYPVKLWARDPKVAAALSKAYGVPCEVGMPDGVQSPSAYSSSLALSNRYMMNAALAQQQMNARRMAAQQRTSLFGGLLGGPGPEG